LLDRQSRSYPWILLGVLSLCYLIATLDRIVISLLVEPIKADLGLSDTQISLLLGLAFVLVYSIAGLPIGFLVDRVNRTRLLGLGVGTWSLMTAMCGLANSFWALFFARAGVGIGEATLTPTGYSLISDAFEKRRLGLALGIFTMGGQLGTGGSLILGGYAIGELSKHGEFHIPLLGVLQPWQLTFVLLAIPGLVIAAIVASIPSPLRKVNPAERPETGAVSAVLDFYRANRALLSRHHLATGLTSLVLYGGYSWVAPFFARVHHWEPAEVGFAAGTVSIVVTSVGLLGGGALGDYLLRYSSHLRLWICAISVSGSAISGLFYPFLHDGFWAMIVFGAMIMFATVPIGVGNAALQHVIPSQIRGRVSAIYFFSLSIVGMSGPTLIALTSDLFFPFPSGIGYATAIIVPIAMTMAAILWVWAIPPYRRLAQQVESQPQPA